MNFKQFKKEWAATMVYKPADFDFEETMHELYIPAVVPSQSEVDYSKVKQTCLCGVSVNLCDKVIMPDYGKRCPCVVAHYNGR